MSLLPEERRTLHRMDDDLSAAEPRLASQFRIFTRLTANDGQPPDEDLVTSPQCLPPRRGLDARGGSPADHRIILALLLAGLLGMLLILTLTGYS
jgi:hypothetical protein